MKSRWYDILTFRFMVTPYVAQILFVLLSVVLVASGLLNIFIQHKHIWSILLTIFIGPVVLRLALESLVVLFRIHEELASIRQAVGKENISNKDIG